MPRIWIGNDSTISTHYDTQDNLAVNVSGRRRFTLFPPDQISNLYIGPIDNTISGAPASMVNIDNPNFKIHPRYKEALKTSIVVDLDPGDAIYIPPLWWHNVRSTGNFNVLVNYWWNNPKYRIESPYTCLLHGLYTISHLPDKERLAWEAFFNHYVFRQNGDPSIHIGEKNKGVLSPMNHGLYRKIKSFVLNQMTQSK